MARRALVGNATDPRQLKRADKKTGDWRADYLGRLRWMLGTPAGRYVLAELLEKGGLFEELMHPDSHIVAWREGRRAFVLELRRDCLEAEPDAFAQMEDEYRRRELRRDFEIDASNAALEKEGDPDRALYTEEA